MDTLLQAQTDVFQRIARTCENLKKSGHEKITVGRIQSTLILLDKKWAQLEEQHASLRSKYWAEMQNHDYFSKDFMSTAEDTYLIQRGRLVDWERAMLPKLDESVRLGESQLTSSRRTALPKIQLPEFSGKYEDWPAFRDHFSATIDSDESLPAIEKLHYLRSCVKGEAASMIQNLPATEGSYKRAWRELSDFYENARLLVRAYFTRFLALQKMKGESAAELKKIFHSVVNTYDALENLGRSVSKSEDLYVHLTVNLLGPRTRDLWDEHTGDSSEPPSYEKLKNFLQRRLQTLDGRQIAKEDATNKFSPSGRSTKSHVTQRKEAAKKGAKGERCSFCQKDHFLMHCDSFKGKAATERKGHVSENKLCLNCLGRHKLSDCLSKKACTVCNERHHTLLHDAYREQYRENSEVTASHVARDRVDNRAVLLATARVRVVDKFGTVQQARALIDQGSEASFISESLAQQLGLPRKHTSVSVIGVGGLKSGVAKGRVTLRVMSHFDDSSIIVSAFVLPRLTAYTGGSKITRQSWSHFKELELADPRFLSPDPVDILLGADVFPAIMQSGLAKGGPHEPIAQQTALGWIISGNVITTYNDELLSTRSFQCVTMESLTRLVRRFWEQEEVPKEEPVLTEEEQRCEELFVSTHARTAEGRYIVKLPLKNEVPDLSSTRGFAMRSLLQMERRFERDDNLRSSYVDFMHQYKELGHMSHMNGSEDKETNHKSCFLPHHGVLKESSRTTKLRVVFNGSQSTTSGESLNDQLLVGKNLLPALTDILLQWREHRYVIATDIEKMYRQILVHPDDRHLQKILWRPDTTSKIQEFELNTVTYGLACAPFLAIRTLRQLADDEAAQFPLGAAALKRDVYVDDILTGANSLREAQQLQQQLIKVCTAGGFPLKKWAANHADLLIDIPPEDRAVSDPREWTPLDSHTMLGLRWHPSSDSFSFTVKAGRPEPITKRSILSRTAQLFDPLGWLAPVVIRAKILIQSTWLKGLNWDAPLDEDDCQSWRMLHEELKFLEHIRIPRWMAVSHDSKSIELHGFADASERAYAAVVYLRTKDVQGRVNITLVAAKTKVAPLKQVSLPRLELCAATLLSQLLSYIQSVISSQITTTHAWLDSTVALSWIQGHPSRWKTFVANRVAEIQRRLPDTSWHHVRSRDNPADCASRGVGPRDLASHALWWRGPVWLSKDESSWPLLPSLIGELPEERKTVLGVIQQIGTEPEVLLRYSCLNKLLRITAWCRRWLKKRHQREQTLRQAAEIAKVTYLSAQELDAAQRAWVLVVQSANYPNELAAVAESKPVPRGSPLLNLSPFSDEHGIMRVGGRLKHSIIAYDEKHPIILPATSHLTELIVRSCHLKTLHGGVQQTLGLLRRQFWIPQGRQVVRRHIHHCITCVRWAATPQQVMADLPRSRVTPARPFQHTGVDYAGPIMLRTSPGRGHKAHKAFLVVFVCLSTKAVHLDVASDYTAEAFLAAFRRFTSRRGLCQTLYSDRGTNFVGADSQLQSLFSASSSEAKIIAKQLASDRIHWQFNPPSAPHFGGLWEAAVKSMKHHVRRVLGDSSLTYEEMATLLSQVEACLNSRPLQALTDDPDDLAALTPGHFLIGAAINAVPENSHLDATGTLARWKHLQRMRDHFWSRWSREYLQGLITRQKWQAKELKLDAGRLCLITNENTPPTKWPLGRIIKLHPGDDGRVRVVTVKTATSERVRPVTKLVLLPCSTATNV